MTLLPLEMKSLAKELSTRLFPSDNRKLDELLLECGGGGVEMGDVIRGSLILLINRPLQMRRLRILFYGEIAIRGGQSVRFTLDSQELPTQLLESKSPFFIKTPHNLSGAFLGRKGAIKSLIYYLEAILEEETETGIVVHHSKRLPLLLPTPRKLIPSGFSDNVSSQKGVRFVRNLIDPSGYLCATLMLSKKVFSPGENLFFSAELLNCSRCLKVEISIVQSANLIADGGVSSLDHVLVRLCLGEMSPEESWKSWHGYSIWIPHPSLAPVHLQQILRRKILGLSYALELRIKYSALHAPLTLRIPFVLKVPPKKKPSNLSRSQSTVGITNF